MYLKKITNIMYASLHVPFPNLAVEKTMEKFETVVKLLHLTNCGGAGLKQSILTAVLQPADELLPLLAGNCIKTTMGYFGRERKKFCSITLLLFSFIPC